MYMFRTCETVVFVVVCWWCTLDVWLQMLVGDGKRQRHIKEKRMLPREEVYDGALEDILCGTVTYLLHCTVPKLNKQTYDII